MRRKMKQNGRKEEKEKGISIKKVLRPKACVGVEQNNKN